ncbi:MAG: helix-turn-helix transcriptional regulator, partial [Ruminococcaceae bacterium]|nr:helix-turn-helix transcriptional regulator [Oscillospiraceae bacterium]
MESYLDRIKLMKNEKKMTNEQLSERTGIPLGTLSKILAGMSDSPSFP